MKKVFTFKFVWLLALTSHTSISTSHELPVPLRNAMKPPLGNFYKVIRYFAPNGLLD